MHELAATGTSASASAPAEHATPPRRVVVHDPTETQAFEVLERVAEDELRERTLFAARPEREAFAAQHAALVAALRAASVEVVRLGGVVGGHDLWRHAHGDPNQVYTRDPVITLPWLAGWFVGGAMRTPIRRGEVALMGAALQALGLRELFTMPAGCFLEGGDVIPFVRGGRRSLLVGFGPRSSRRGLDVLCERLLPWAADEVVAIRLDDRRMNLDGVLVPVAADTVLAEPGSIETAFVRDRTGERAVDVLDLLRSDGMTVLEVTREESTAMQACNCVCLGGRRIVCYDLCERVVDALGGCGIDVCTIPGSELVKGTGGPRCMTRPLYV